MNVEKALDNIVVNRKEKESIERYINGMHTNINILVDLTPENYAKLEGWNLAKTPEKFEQLVKDFINIYSAMLKDNTKSENLKDKSQLVRGTSNSMAQKMGKVPCGFLSTTNDDYISKRFTEYGEASLLHFKLADGIPFLDVNKYAGNHLGEQETILSPFCNIINKEFVGKTENTFNNYIVELGAPNLQEVPKEQLQSIWNEIIPGYTQFIKDVEEYIELPRQIDKSYNDFKRAVNAHDREDMEFVKQQIEKQQKRLDEVKQSTSIYKEKLQILLKGLCKQREIEITSSREFLEQEKERLAKAKLESNQAKTHQETYDRVRQKQIAQMAEMQRVAKQELITSLQQEISSNRKQYGNLKQRYNHYIK